MLKHLLRVASQVVLRQVVQELDSLVGVLRLRVGVNQRLGSDATMQREARMRPKSAKLPSCSPSHVHTDAASRRASDAQILQPIWQHSNIS